MSFTGAPIFPYHYSGVLMVVGEKNAEIIIYGQMKIGNVNGESQKNVLYQGYMNSGEASLIETGSGAGGGQGFHLDSLYIPLN